MKKTAKIIIMALIVVLVFTMGAFAAANNETISALLNRSIRINYNGVEQTFKDATGTQVYPISYNGTTYLPVRAMSNLLGLNIEWNGATNTIDIGSKDVGSKDVGSNDAQSVKLIDVWHDKDTKYNYIISDKAALTVKNGSGANQEFNNGVEYYIWNGLASAGSYNGMYFNCAEYSTLSCKVWSDIDAEAIIYDNNNKVLTRFDVQAGQIVDKEIALNGATRIALEGNGHGRDQLTKGGHIRFFDPVLK